MVPRGRASVPAGGKNSPQQSPKPTAPAAAGTLNPTQQQYRPDGPRPNLHLTLLCSESGVDVGIAARILKCTIAGDGCNNSKDNTIGEHTAASDNGQVVARYAAHLARIVALRDGQIGHEEFEEAERIARGGGEAEEGESSDSPAAAEAAAATTTTSAAAAAAVATNAASANGNGKRSVSPNSSNSGKKRPTGGGNSSSNTSNRKGHGAGNTGGGNTGGGGGTSNNYSSSGGGVNPFTRPIGASYAALLAGCSSSSSSTGEGSSGVVTAADGSTLTAAEVRRLTHLRDALPDCELAMIPTDSTHYHHHHHHSGVAHISPAAAPVIFLYRLLNQEALVEVVSAAVAAATAAAGGDKDKGGGGKEGDGGGGAGGINSGVAAAVDTVDWQEVVWQTIQPALAEAQGHYNRINAVSTKSTTTTAAPRSLRLTDISVVWAIADSFLLRACAASSVQQSSLSSTATAGDGSAHAAAAAADSHKNCPSLKGSAAVPATPFHVGGGDAAADKKPSTYTAAVIHQRLLHPRVILYLNKSGFADPTDPLRAQQQQQQHLLAQQQLAQQAAEKASSGSRAARERATAALAAATAAVAAAAAAGSGGGARSSNSGPSDSTVKYSSFFFGAAPRGRSAASASNGNAIRNGAANGNNINSRPTTPQGVAATAGDAVAAGAATSTAPAFLYEPSCSLETAAADFAFYHQLHSPRQLDCVLYTAASFQDFVAKAQRFLFQTRFVEEQRARVFPGAMTTASGPPLLLSAGGGGECSHAGGATAAAADFAASASPLQLLLLSANHEGGGGGPSLVDFATFLLERHRVYQLADGLGSSYNNGAKGLASQPPALGKRTASAAAAAAPAAAATAGARGGAKGQAADASRQERNNTSNNTNVGGARALEPAAALLARVVARGAALSRGHRTADGFVPPPEPPWRVERLTAAASSAGGAVSADAPEVWASACEAVAAPLLCSLTAIVDCYAQWAARKDVTLLPSVGHPDDETAAATTVTAHAALLLPPGESNHIGISAEEGDPLSDAGGGGGGGATTMQSRCVSTQALRRDAALSAAAAAAGEAPLRPRRAPARSSTSVLSAAAPLPESALYHREKRTAGAFTTATAALALVRQATLNIARRRPLRLVRPAVQGPPPASLLALRGGAFHGVGDNNSSGNMSPNSAKWLSSPERRDGALSAVRAAKAIEADAAQHGVRVEAGTKATLFHGEKSQVVSNTNTTTSGGDGGLKQRQTGLFRSYAAIAAAIPGDAAGTHSILAEDRSADGRRACREGDAAATRGNHVGSRPGSSPGLARGRLPASSPAGGGGSRPTSASRRSSLPIGGHSSYSARLPLDTIINNDMDNYGLLQGSPKQFALPTDHTTTRERPPPFPQEVRWLARQYVKKGLGALPIGGNSGSTAVAAAVVAAAMSPLTDTGDSCAYHHHSSSQHDPHGGGVAAAVAARAKMAELQGDQRGGTAASEAVREEEDRLLCAVFGGADASRPDTIEKQSNSSTVDAARLIYPSSEDGEEPGVAVDVVELYALCAARLAPQSVTATTATSEMQSAAVRRLRPREREHILAESVMAVMAEAGGILTAAAGGCGCHDGAGPLSQSSPSSSAAAKVPPVVEEKVSLVAAASRIAAYRQRFGEYATSLLSLQLSGANNENREGVREATATAFNPASLASVDAGNICPLRAPSQVWLCGLREGGGGGSGCGDANDSCGQSNNNSSGNICGCGAASARTRSLVWVYPWAGVLSLSEHAASMRWLHTATSPNSISSNTNAVTSCSPASPPSSSSSSSSSSSALLLRLPAGVQTQLRRLLAHLSTPSIVLPSAALCCGGAAVNSAHPYQSVLHGLSLAAEGRKIISPYASGVVTVATTADSRVCQYAHDCDVIASLHYHRQHRHNSNASNKGCSDAEAEEDKHLTVRFDDGLTFTVTCHTPSLTELAAAAAAVASGAANGGVGGRRAGHNAPVLHSSSLAADRAPESQLVSASSPSAAAELPTILALRSASETAAAAAAAGAGSGGGGLDTSVSVTSTTTVDPDRADEESDATLSSSPTARLSNSGSAATVGGSLSGTASAIGKGKQQQQHQHQQQEQLQGDDRLVQGLSQREVVDPIRPAGGVRLWLTGAMEQTGLLLPSPSSRPRHANDGNTQHQQHAATAAAAAAAAAAVGQRIVARTTLDVAVTTNVFIVGCGADGTRVSMRYLSDSTSTTSTASAAAAAAAVLPQLETIRCARVDRSADSTLVPTREVEVSRQLLTSSSSSSTSGGDTAAAGSVVRFFASGLSQVLFADGAVLTRFEQPQPLTSAASEAATVETLVAPSGLCYVRTAAAVAVKLTAATNSTGCGGGGGSAFVRLTGHRFSRTVAADDGAGNSCALVSREDGVSSAYYHPILDDGPHSRFVVSWKTRIASTREPLVNTAPTQAADCVRVVVHADGTTITTLPPPRKGGKDDSSSGGGPRYSRVIAPLLAEVRGVAKAAAPAPTTATAPPQQQRAAAGATVPLSPPRYCVESARMPRVFLFDEEPDTGSSTSNSDGGGGGGGSNSSYNPAAWKRSRRTAALGAAAATAVQRPTSLPFYISFGDGTVLLRRPTTTATAASSASSVARNATRSTRKQQQQYQHQETTTTAAAHSNSHNWETILSRSTGTSLRVFHAQCLAVLEPADVMDRHHATGFTRLHALAAAEGLPCFDLALGGMRLVDMSQRVTSVARLFPSPTMINMPPTTTTTATTGNGCKDDVEASLSPRPLPWAALLRQLVSAGYTPHRTAKQRNSNTANNEHPSGKAAAAAEPPLLLHRLRDLGESFIVAGGLLRPESVRTFLRRELEVQTGSPAAAASHISALLAAASASVPSTNNTDSHTQSRDGVDGSGCGSDVSAASVATNSSGITGVAPLRFLRLSCGEVLQYCAARQVDIAVRSAAAEGRLMAALHQSSSSRGGAANPSTTTTTAANDRGERVPSGIALVRSSGGCVNGADVRGVDQLFIYRSPGGNNDNSNAGSNAAAPSMPSLATAPDDPSSGFEGGAVLSRRAEEQQRRLAHLHSGTAPRALLFSRTPTTTAANRNKATTTITSASSSPEDDDDDASAIVTSLGSHWLPPVVRPIAHLHSRLHTSNRVNSNSCAKGDSSSSPAAPSPDRPLRIFLELQPASAAVRGLLLSEVVSQRTRLEQLCQFHASVATQPTTTTATAAAVAVAVAAVGVMAAARTKGILSNDGAAAAAGSKQHHHQHQHHQQHPRIATAAAEGGDGSEPLTPADEKGVLEAARQQQRRLQELYHGIKDGSG